VNINWKNIPMADLVVNRDFILRAAQCNPPARIDGRGASEFRKTEVCLSNSNGRAEASFGRTLVSACVTGEVTAPLPDHPNEGRLFFNVELGQIANPDLYEYGKPTAECVSLCNYVERVLRGSKAFDNESLCILGGKSVWSIRCDIHVLNDDGALPDVCVLAALSALMNFKHASTSLDGDQAVMHSDSARDPVPISAHHFPISSTFAVYTSGGKVSWFVDPMAAEEKSFNGVMSIAVNQHGELCSVHKPGGIAIDVETLAECSHVAVDRANAISRSVSELIERMGRKTDKTLVGSAFSAEITC